MSPRDDEIVFFVCLSVCLSVTLVDCDHVVQQKVEMDTYDSIGRCLGIRGSRSGSYRRGCCEETAAVEFRLKQVYIMAS